MAAGRALGASTASPPVHADQALDTLRRVVLVLRRVLRQFRLPFNFCAGKNRGVSGCLRPWCSYPTHGSIVFAAPTHCFCAGQHVARGTCSHLRCKSCFGCYSCPVLSARNIEQLTKNAALSSFVLSRFFHLTPAGPKLNGTRMRQMEGSYRNLVRVASGRPCLDGIPAQSLAQMLAKVSQHPMRADAQARPRLPWRIVCTLSRIMAVRSPSGSWHCVPLFCEFSGRFDLTRRVYSLRGLSLRFRLTS